MTNESFTVDFIGIGDHKSATSWMFKCLREHPQICGSSDKETRFFDDDDRYVRGVEYYEHWFAQCAGNTVRGEFSPSYFHNPKTPERIHQTFPQAKLLVVLRNPVEKAYSLYRYNKVGGTGSTVRFNSFEEAVENAPAVVNDNFHFHNLERFRKFFRDDQIHVVIYKDIMHDPRKVMQGVYEFLEVDPTFVAPSLYTPVNKTGVVRLRYPRLTRLGAHLYHFLRTIPGVADIVPFARIKRLVYKYGHTKGEALSSYEPIQTETRSKLKSLYEDDIQKLERYLGRRLPWN